MATCVATVCRLVQYRGVADAVAVGNNAVRYDKDAVKGAFTRMQQHTDTGKTSGVRHKESWASPARTAAGTIATGLLALPGAPLLAILRNDARQLASMLRGRRGKAVTLQLRDTIGVLSSVAKALLLLFSPAAGGALAFQ